jgi:hypothetical protein
LSLSSAPPINMTGPAPPHEAGVPDRVLLFGIHSV